mmetsp:Transcript_29638/g.81120  ORF Transcript_29638/g.81120 Transcript_29638/m.81120 type:complete len:204 (+) Transcript_29638:1428-2039(+)
MMGRMHSPSLPLYPSATHSKLAPSSCAELSVSNFELSGARSRSRSNCCESSSSLRKSTRTTSAPGTLTAEGLSRVSGSSVSPSITPSRPISSMTKLWSKGFGGWKVAVSRALSGSVETSMPVPSTSVPCMSSTPGQFMGRGKHSASWPAVVPGSTRRGPQSEAPLSRPTVSSGPTPLRRAFAMEAAVAESGLLTEYINNENWI